MTTQQTKAVDWSQPIEAVHEDGRVVAVTAVRADDGDMVTYQDLDGCRRSFRRDTGKSWLSHVHWRIRNVAQPEAPTPSPELTARMVALVRRMAIIPDWMLEHASQQGREDVAEARSILAELEPVDEHEAYADALLKQQGWHGEPSIGFAAVARMIATAHEEGRVLAEAGK